MSDLRFRRQRLARWADEATLDRLEEEFAGLSDEEKAERNAYIDSRSDADVRELLGEQTDADVTAAKKAAKAGKPRRASRAAPPAPPAEAVEAPGGADAAGGAEA